MKQLNLMIVLCLVCNAALQAQTWTGSAGTDWNNQLNWNPQVVPGTNSAVTIPNTANKPVLANDVTLSTINMNNGSALDFNGFALTVNGSFDFAAATLNNSSSATDIVITFNGGSVNYFRQSTINDNLIINYNSAQPFYEAFQGGNVYNGNADFNVGGSGLFFLCYDNRSTFNGNVTVNRIVAGTSRIFSVGAMAVGGNFSYTNNAGGATYIGEGAPANIPVAGMVNIQSNPAGLPPFSMNKVKNQTSGGTISIQNSGVASISNDTLVVSAFNLNFFKTNNISDILQNSITGTINISDSVGNSGGTYFRKNTLNGNTTFTLYSSGTFYEAYQGGNVYNGNTNFYVSGTGLLHVCYDHTSLFNNDLNVTRTVPGTTRIFSVGAIGVTGNFSYTNNAGGATYIGEGAPATIPVGGMVNIQSNPAGFPAFSMSKIKNQTTGGTISIQKSGLANISNDTLLVAAFNLNFFKSNSISDVLQNSITGAVNISDSVGNSGGSYFRKNTINGNMSYTVYSTGTLYEAYQGGNIYNGNATFNAAGTAPINICYDSKSSFNGHLDVNRTVAGQTFIVSSGFNTLTGNFTYTNNAGGLTRINNGNVQSPTVGGTVNIDVNTTGYPLFEMNRIKNQTTGGTVSVQNSGAVSIANDTLLLNAFNINFYKSNNTSDFIQNKIAGAINISDSVGNSGGTYIRRNIFTGNTTYTCYSTSTLLEAYQGGNVYNGDASFTGASNAALYICYDAKSSFNGNLFVNRTAVAGQTFVFNSGFTALAGNFTFTNNVGGGTRINPSNALSGIIGGSINVTATGTGNPFFEMNRLKNLTGGGNILLANSGIVTITQDTLLIDSLNVTGINSGSASNFDQNSITGAVNIADAATNGAMQFRRNSIQGNTTLTENGGTLYEAYQGANNYNGDLTLNRNGGIISFAYDNPTNVNRSLFLNSASGINITNPIKFGGSNNGVLEQLGTQVINIPTLIMQKTGGATLTLNDSVTIITTATFTSGNIVSSAGNNLIFPNNISYTGASLASHVVGPVTKIGDDAFTFPVGGPGTYNPVTMSVPTGTTSKFSAEYKAQNPTIDGYNTNSKAASFGSAIISNAGYWDVQRLEGTTNVTLKLGFRANPYEQYPVLADLKVAHWTGSQWDDNGNGGTTGTSDSGTVMNSTPITTFSPFAIAGVVPTYFFSATNPGTGPDGTPFKIKGINGFPAYMVKPLPGGTYTPDSIFLVPNGGTASFRIKDLYGVEKDTTVSAPIAPTNYISSNGNGTKNFTGWRHFVYMTDAGNNIMGAIADKDLTLGNTTMNTYFSTANVATSPNGNIYLKRSFRITTQFHPLGTTRVRFYITKTEFNNLVAATPSAFPSGINSLTITKYSGPQEDSLFNPIPGGNAVIIPNSAIIIADLGTMYSLDVDVTGFSGFYIGGNNSNLNVCSGSTISLPSNISGTTYQWQRSTGGNTFTNINNGGGYSGTNTSTLTITNPGGSFYGYKFRALVDGVSYSQVYTLKYNSLWQGTVNSDWSNAANWSCNQLPDGNTDVIVNSGKPNYPVLNLNTTIRTMTVKPGAIATIGAGFNLTIKK